MKNKKALLLSAGLVLMILVSLCVVLAQKDVLFVDADTNLYSITMNSSKNKFFSGTGLTKHSGNSTIQTDLGNDIDFTYSNIAGGSSSVWHMLDKDNAYFYNTTPIHGMKSLSVTFTSADKDFNVYWSNDGNFTNEKSKSLTSSTTAISCDFNHDYPTYFKFTNESGLNLSITNLSISLTCLNNYPSLSISSSNDAMGTVSGTTGVIKSGAFVTISASANNGYKFIGWYSGLNLVSSKANYSFIMGYEDLNYVANFTYESYNLVINSESNEKGSVSDSNGSYNYLESVTISASPNEGYSFDGWYSGTDLVSNSNPYTFEMPFNDIAYTARFSANYYDVQLVNANPDLGTITGDGSYAYASVVTLQANPNTGIAFSGWYDENVLVSLESTYIFDMPHRQVQLTAKFEYVQYNVVVSINDDSMGSVSGDGTYIYGQRVTLVATPEEHHSFFGWYQNNSLISSETTISFDMPASGVSYEARFVKNYYINAYSDDETLGTVYGPTECGAGLEATINAVGNTPYILDYWADENYDEIAFTQSYTFTMPEHDVEIIAVFGEGFELSVTSGDLTKGTTDGSGVYCSGRQATATVTVNDGRFKGWYDSSNNLISKKNPYTFNMPNHNYSLYAVFMNQQEESDIDKGLIPYFDEYNNVVTYGMYPQSRETDASIISALNQLDQYDTDTNGFYSYNGQKYSKDDQSYHDVMYYRVELIYWNILSIDDTSAILISQKVLDYWLFDDNKYDGQRHYYKDSALRNWCSLFYSMAFENNTYVDDTLVTNDGGDTTDKVYILSQTELMALSKEERNASPTDYYYQKADFEYTGYWSRTPSYRSSYLYPIIVDEYGNIEEDGGRHKYGVRPCIKIHF